MRVFYSRAMDGLAEEAILADDRIVVGAISRLGFSLVNPYLPDSRRGHVRGIPEIVDLDIANIGDADVVIANLSIAGHSYVGAVGEIITAFRLRKPVFVWVGDTQNYARVWLKYHADAITRTLDDVVDLLDLSCTDSGRAARHEETLAYYSAASRCFDSVDAMGAAAGIQPDRVAQRKQEGQSLREAVVALGVRGFVLDLGSGTGAWVPVWLRSAERVICVDSSSEMLSISRSRNPTDRVDHIKGNILDAEWLERLIAQLGHIETVVLGFILNSMTFQEGADLIRMLRSPLASGTRLVVMENQSSLYSDPQWFSRSQIEVRKLPKTTRVFRLYKRNFLSTDILRTLDLWGEVETVFCTEDFFSCGVAVLN